MPSDRRVNSTLGVLEVSAGNSLVLSREAVNLYLLRQFKVGGIVLGDYKETAGILVDTVDYSGADNAVYARKAVSAVVQESVNESPRVVAVSRVYHHALGLVDHKEVVVLIDDIQRDILGNGVHGLRLGNGDGYLLAAPELVVLAYGFAACKDQSLFDESLYCRACKLRNIVRNVLVYTASLILGSSRENCLFTHLSPPFPQRLSSSFRSSGR